MLEYRFKFYLNALHSILIDGKMGDAHPHTWEIVVGVFKQNSGFIAFSDVEKPVEALLQPFQNKNMNTIPPFDTLNPTLENVTKYFQEKLETMFIGNGFMMSRIEVSETPSRSFIIDIKSYEEEALSNPVHNNLELIHEESEKLVKRKAEKLLKKARKKKLSAAENDESTSV